MVNGLPGTEHADRERILNASTEGCCANDAWRGRLCTYHDGFADGLDEVGVEYTRLAEAAAVVVDAYSNNSTVMACSLSDAVSALRDVLGQGHQSEEPR